MIDTLVDRTLTGCFQAQHQLGTLFRNVDWFDVLMHVCCHVGASSPIWAKILLSGNGWHTPLEWVTGTLTDLKIVHPPPPSAGPGEFRGAIFEWHPLPSSGRRFVVVFLFVLHSRALPLPANNSADILFDGLQGHAASQSTGHTSAFKGPKMDPDCFLLEFKNGMLVRFVPSLDNCRLRLDFRYGCYGMQW